MVIVPPGLSGKMFGKTFQLPDDADPGAAHEPDPLEARVIALEASVKRLHLALEDVIRELGELMTGRMSP